MTVELTLEKLFTHFSRVAKVSLNLCLTVCYNHTATQYNTLQRTHCNTLHHTHCNTLQHTATHCNTARVAKVSLNLCLTLCYNLGRQRRRLARNMDDWS